ncbi:MAG: hypothetical protein N2V78_03015 [Methanophagales archaeon]|nr:hypothetical protein [Methanophagales archaeon]
MEEINEIKEDEISNLELILNEAKESRKEKLDRLIVQESKMWTALNFLPILIGIYLTSAVFMHEKRPISLSLPLGISLTLFAIVICLMGVLPSIYSTIKPDVMYALTEDKRKDILDKLIQTYLIDEKQLILKIEKNALFMMLIIVLTIGSIIEFIYFGAICFIFKDESLSIFWVILIGLICGCVVYRYKERTDRLKKELE